MLSMLLVITVSVTAAGSEVYFNPQEGSAEFCDNVSVEIWANATGFQGGQINLTYDSSCANVTGWERNTTNFLIGGWSHYDGREGITFSTMDPQPVLLTGNYMIGTITIHCVSEEGCETPLAFIDPSRLLDDRGYPVSANWTDGTFRCKNECEGTDTSCGIYPNCENCTEKDGCYVYDNGCEERDYYCESNEEGCNYTYTNRYNDYYEDWVFYCKDDTIWKHRIFVSSSN
uniref:Cohesin domain-containing protein n=1 Tax=Candidatus Methanophaga sp. ANME-1 ERB7 TaxID=2759913 RepID=A0A7G9Z686_9EURY|nr:hypothetical protein DIJDKDOB_00001 [Methanosarcinales archaeon ANME-1 ERB7]